MPKEQELGSGKGVFFFEFCRTGESVLPSHPSKRQVSFYFGLRGRPVNSQRCFLQPSSDWQV